MGGHLARFQGHKGTMASMGMTIFGTGSTTPTVLRTGGTRMAVPTGPPRATESHTSVPEVGVRDSSALWGISGAAQ